jgi:hypothetical protein
MLQIHSGFVTDTQKLMNAFVTVSLLHFRCLLATGPAHHHHNETSAAAAAAAAAAAMPGGFRFSTRSLLIQCPLFHVPRFSFRYVCTPCPACEQLCSLRETTTPLPLLLPHYSIIFISHFTFISTAIAAFSSR